MNGNLLSPERLLSRTEVENVFGISRRFLEIAAVKGNGPPMVRLGRSVRYRYSDLSDWINAQRVNSTSEVG